MPSGDLPSKATPSAETIRETAREVLSRSEYDLEPLREGSPFWWNLLVDALRWVMRPFVQLFDWLSDISPALAWLVVILLFVVAVALIVHIVYTFKTVLGRRRGRGKASYAEDRRRQDPSKLEQQSRESAMAGDWISAIRQLFKAGLLRLADWEERTLRPGLTNREHMRHYHNAPVHAPLQTFVDTIDTKWYGGGECFQDDYTRCAQAHEKICHWIRNSRHDHRA